MNNINEKKPEAAYSEKVQEDQITKDMSETPPPEKSLTDKSQLESGVTAKGAYICNKCNTELMQNQKFCHQCGHKVKADPLEENLHEANTSEQSNKGSEGTEQVRSKNDQLNETDAKAHHQNKKKAIVIAISAIIIAITAIGGIILIPEMFKDAEGYMAEGNYEKAYEKAETNKEKLQVKIENLAAVQAASLINTLKDPSSFSLRDAYYQEQKNNYGTVECKLVLHVTGKNSFGANVGNYWLYSFNPHKNKWEYLCYVADLEIDSDPSKNRKTAIESMGKVIVNGVIKSDVKLSKNGIQRINKMFKEDKLDEIKLLDIKWNQEKK